MEVIRVIGILVSPFLPNSSVSILNALGCKQELALSAAVWGNTVVGKKVTKIDSLFPRKETKELKENTNQKPKDKMDTSSATPTPPAAPEIAAVSDEITIDYFSKVKLRVGQVMSAEKLEKSEKL